MIPQAHIQAWREHAPWPNPAQVEQDLIICRALCNLFNAPSLSGKIAWRGGTAIHKLLFKQPLRYSEDIDLVQTQAEPIGATVDAIRDSLSWLGKCQREQAGHSMHLVFRFAPESAPQTALKLKVEINTREHEALFGYRRYPFEVASDWYSARAEIVSFEPEELFGTKLRALLQRRKNRDLFDLHHGRTQLSLNRDKVVTCLNHYLAFEDHPISPPGAPMRIRRQLCVGIVLIAMLGSASAEADPARAGALSGSLLESSRTLILLDYQRVHVQDDAPIDLMGAHFVRQVNDWLLLGVGVQAPLLSGNYGGFATFDVGAYAKKHLGSRVFVTAGLFGGAGAGGRSVENAKALSGSGTLTRAYVGLGYDFGSVSVGVNLSKLEIRHAAVGGTQADVFLEVPYGVLTGPFAMQGQLLAPADAAWARAESGPSMLTLSDDNFSQIRPQGSRQGGFSTADLQYSHFFLGDTYWYAGLGIGYRGLPTYNQFLGGVGQRLRLSQRFTLYGQLGIGSGGYAPEVIDTGPGLVVYPKLAVEYALTRNVGVSLTGGYLAAAKGSSKNFAYGLALTRHVGVQDGADAQGPTVAPPAYRGVRLGLFQQTEFDVRYADVARRSLPTLGIQGDLILDDHWYVPLQAAAAYHSYLGYPGYDEVLGGIGLQSRANPADRLQFFGQLMAGANLHGRAAKASLGTRVFLSDDLSLSLVAGRIAAQSASGNRFSANSVAVGLETRFSFPGW